MIPCHCQTTGHDPGCPNGLAGTYVLTPDGQSQKLAEPLLYSQRQLNDQLIAAHMRIRELERLAEMLLGMSNPFCDVCGKRPDPEGPLCSYSWNEARWVCFGCSRP